MGHLRKASVLRPEMCHTIQRGVKEPVATPYIHTKYKICQHCGMVNSIVPSIVSSIMATTVYDKMKIKR